jgi:hypothetical protein
MNIFYLAISIAIAIMILLLLAQYGLIITGYLLNRLRIEHPFRGFDFTVLIPFVLWLRLISDDRIYLIKEPKKNG